MSKGLLGLGLILAVAALGSGATAAGLPPSVCGAYAPVQPAFTFQTLVSGATSAYTYSPGTPDGLIVALHGTGGSAANLAVQKVEWQSFFNDAVARNYAILIPESDDRSVRQWSTRDSFQDNKDAVRIAGLINQLGLKQAPVFIVGMSQGGGSAPIISILLKSEGFQVRALGVYSAGDTKAFRDQRYNLPVMFNLMSADSLINQTSVRSNVDALKRRKIDAEIFVKPAERVCPLRFARIKEIRDSDSTEIYADLVADGVLTTNGAVTLKISDKVDVRLDLPGVYLRYQAQIGEQMGAASAQHMFYSDRNQATLDFFDRY